MNHSLYFTGQNAEVMFKHTDQFTAPEGGDGLALEPSLETELLGLVTPHPPRLLCLFLPDASIPSAYRYPERPFKHQDGRCGFKV